MADIRWVGSFITLQIVVSHVTAAKPPTLVPISSALVAAELLLVSVCHHAAQSHIRMMDIRMIELTPENYSPGLSLQAMFKKPHCIVHLRTLPITNEQSLSVCYSKGLGRKHFKG